MAVIKEKQTAVEFMFKGSASPEAICTAIEDAEIFVKCYGGVYTADEFSLLVRYYACHLLFMWGFAKSLTSKSVGDVSESYEGNSLGDKEATSPYLQEFRKLINSDELIVSI